MSPVNKESLPLLSIYLLCAFFVLLHLVGFQYSAEGEGWKVLVPSLREKAYTVDSGTVWRIRTLTPHTVENPCITFKSILHTCSSIRLDSTTCKSCSTVVHVCWKKSLCMLDSYDSNSDFSRVRLSFLTFKCSYRFFVDIVYQIKKYPTVPGVMIVFVKNRCWILSAVFSASIDMIIQFFLFIKLMW